MTTTRRHTASYEYEGNRYLTLGDAMAAASDRLLAQPSLPGVQPPDQIILQHPPKLGDVVCGQPETVAASEMVQSAGPQIPHGFVPAAVEALEGDCEFRGMWYEVCQRAADVIEAAVNDAEPIVHRMKAALVVDQKESE